MRTTLTLDDDVAAQLRRLRKVRKEAKLKELINEALRQGLRHLTAPAGPRKPYHTAAVSLGRCLIGGIDDVAEVLAVAEDDAFR
ncbi:MAG TPA: hypothetical protein VNK46_02720 [Nitrospiraceae bacterium]|jgi:hypothetical protein|nr:hypothetical protein [Nitrospiraceae bacterium]